jgi:hypothetical protein
MQVTALITLHVDGEVIKPNQTVSLDKDEANKLIARGFATAIGGLSGKDKPQTKAENTPSLEDIIEVIEMLDPAKDYGKSGKPNVDAIETMLETNISADLRDQAWTQVLADRNANAS